MKRHLLMTMAAVLAIAAAATGPARAQNASPDVTLDFTSNTWGIPEGTEGKTAAENSYTSGGYTITLCGSSGNGYYFSPTEPYILLGKQGAYLQLPAFSSAVDSIKVVGSPNASTSVEQNIYVDDNNSWVAVSTQTTGMKNVTQKYVINENYRAAGNIYFIKVDNSYNTQIKKVLVYFTPVPPVPITVRLAAGTVEAANWTLASGNASVPGTQVLQGIMSGSQLTATYDGDLKVKEVIATKHLEPNEIPLTIEALTAGTIVVQNPQSGMKYTLNGGAKTAVTSNINVAAGDKVAFYGNGTSITCYIGTQISGGTADVKAYGNIMSLVDENGFATATTLTANDAFSSLFLNYAHLKDISGLVLPATTLRQYCYMSMFNGCTGLTTVPSDLLPATTLANSCYAGMFSDCENLTNVPTLPATTLSQFCYNNMFRACNGLTTVPTDLLPATMLAPSCYSYMFLNCSNLTTAPALPATTLAERCYSSMFANCTTLAASPVLPATTLVSNCYQQMFYGCENLAAAPVLPATTLASSCYQQMFYGCENLATVPDTLPATTLASYCYQQMFYGCSNLATAPVLPATTLASYCYQQMFYNCYNLSSVTCLATSGINQNYSTEDWLSGAGSSVQDTKTFVANPYILWPEGDSGIPEGWTRKNPDGSDWTVYIVPLTIEALTAGNVVVQNPPSGMQYTLNGGAKTAMTEASTVITVAVGDKVAFYGDGTSITRYGGTVIGGGYDGTAEVKVYGNIMSLVNETGFATATTLTANNAFTSLFGSYFNLKDISGLKLPATTLTMGCYDGMFSYCTGLTTVPSDLLPATTLAESCYAGMFGGCENLTNVPTLPANTLARECYSNMFYYCTGLTTVPSNLLPATTLAEQCYSYMFHYCLNLTTAPVLPATTLVASCYLEMFSSCYNLSSVTCLATSGINQNNSTEFWLDRAGSSVQGTKTFNAVSTAEWPEGNSNGIPSGWTRQNIDN